jgi:hypothetical protein
MAQSPGGAWLKSVTTVTGHGLFFQIVLAMASDGKTRGLTYGFLIDRWLI